MFQPPAVWTLLHVHHQEDIKQDAEYQMGAGGGGGVKKRSHVCSSHLELMRTWRRDGAAMFRGETCASGDLQVTFR